MNNLEKSRLKSVNDEFIGTLQYEKHIDHWVFKLRDDYASTFVDAGDFKSKNVIAVILESPHKHEFENISLSSLSGETVKCRPLNNTNSRNALIYILENVMIRFYEKSKIYNIVLINAVQFQTSLGLEDKDIRNENWIKNWIDFKDDFINRLKSVEPSLIFNLCTQGTYKNHEGQFQDIDMNYLNRFGYTFSNNDSDKILFQARKSFGMNKITLQDSVEFELDNKGLITNDNYTKYYHPSRFTHQKTPCYPVLEKKNKINFCKSIVKITTYNKT